ncbi:heme-binding protein 2, partial [Silurus meridionalis]
ICIVGAVVLLFSITADARIGNSTEPTSYCTETEECLLFDLICNGTEYEVRHYEAAKWVTTEEKSMFKDVAIMKAFKKLFNYITGENEAGVKIPMTAPVLIKVKEEMPFLEPAVYGLSFLLPSAYQDNAPKPTDSTVHLEEMTDMKVYVISYGGWMVGPVSTIYADLLKKALDNVKATYNTDYHYDAGYNSPMKLLNRHNEVWYVVSGAPVCPHVEHPSPSSPAHLR